MGINRRRFSQFLLGLLALPTGSIAARLLSRPSPRQSGSATATIDGAPFTNGARVLLNGQQESSSNGIYMVRVIRLSLFEIGIY